MVSFGGAAVAGSIAFKSYAEVMPRKEGFLWGAATAAYQVEGNNTNSDLWLIEGLPATPFKERSGDACDHYHRYDDDIAMLSRLGLNTYRFSIEWARIEPDEGLFSPAILAHYGRMLESCRRHGVTPIVTLHHFSSPRWFSAKGGFENPDAPKLFARYAKIVTEALGDQIGFLCTINEANLSFAPNQAVLEEAARSTGVDKFSTFLFSNVARSKPIVRACHAAAREAVKAIRPALPVGYTLAMDDFQDALGTQGRAARLRSAMYDVWLNEAKSDDFLGVQTYTRTIVGERGPVVLAPDALRTQIGQEYYPEALGGAVRYAASTAGVPIIVTENGVATDDDELRVRYIDGALASLRAAMRDGVDVRGYVYWSLLDNFEWLFGYGAKFGLIAVDRSSQRRALKPSAKHLGKIARTGHRASRA